MSLSARLFRSIQDCLDLLLPPACHLCGHLLSRGLPATGFCAGCLAGIRPVVAACRRCNRPLAQFSARPHTCESCLRQPPAFATVLSLGYHAGTLKTAIHGLKYRQRLHLAGPLGRLLAEQLAAVSPADACDLVVPVPLHAERLRQRGYNQALEIARPVARRLGAPLDRHGLQRTRVTPAQQGLSLKARRNNLRNAFQFAGNLDHQRVLLIDDVMTSGATVRGCSEALRQAGALEVRVAVVGRA